MYSLDKYYQVFKVENVKNIFCVLVQKISIYDIIWPFFLKVIHKTQTILINNKYGYSLRLNSSFKLLRGYLKSSDQNVYNWYSVNFFL